MARCILMRGIVILALLCISGSFSSASEGDLFFVVQYRKNSPVGISTVKSIHSNFTKKAKSKHVVVEHFFKTNFDLLDRPRQPSNTVRLKLTLNREIVSPDVFDDSFSLPAENCFYHGIVQKYSIPSIALSTCGESPGLHGLLVRKNDTLWITPEKVPDMLPMMDDAKYSSDHNDDEIDMDQESFVPPLPHRVRLYHAFSDGIDKCATTTSFNFHGFDAGSRIDYTNMQSHQEKQSGSAASRTSENLRDHRIALAVRLDASLISYFNEDAKLATSNVLSALNMADLVTQRFGLQLVVSSIKLWKYNTHHEVSTAAKPSGGNISSLAFNQTPEMSSPSSFSPTNPRLNLHRLIAYNKNRLRELVQHDFSPESGSSSEVGALQSPSVLVVFSGIAASNISSGGGGGESPSVAVPLDACVPFSICSSEMHRAVIFISLSTPARSSSSSPLQLTLTSSFLHQLAHALGFRAPSSDEEVSSSPKCPSCSHAWHCLGSAAHGDVRNLIAPLLTCQFGSDSLHGFSRLHCLLPVNTASNVQKALLGDAVSGVESRDWHSLSMSDGQHRNNPAGISSSSSKKNYCGDGIVGVGEECDCHFVASQSGSSRYSHSKSLQKSTCIFKSCCDPATCLLVEWAQCSPSLASECCTDNCTLKPATSICRPSKNACDLPEQCTTLNGRCPADRRVANGFSCLLASATDMSTVPSYGQDNEFANGVCFAGDCKSRDIACQNLWGSSGRSAHNKCYDTMKKCDGEDDTMCDNDIFCDSLQCQIDSSSAYSSIIAPHANLTFVVSRLHGSGGGLENVIECRHLVSGGKKTVDKTQQQTNNQIGFVPDWAPCGPGKVCHQKHCVDMKTLNSAVCPLGPASGISSTELIPCSGNGWCTVERHSSPLTSACICKPFFTGLACEFHIFAPGVWPDVGLALNRTHATGVSFLGGFGAWLTERLLLTAVVPFVGIILIGFSFFVICYRRKLIMIRPSKHKKRKPSSLRRQHNKNRPASFKGDNHHKEAGDDDDDLQSPVLLCTTTNLVAPQQISDEIIIGMDEDNHNFDDEKCHLTDVVNNVENGDLSQQPALYLNRQPERGILKKKAVAPVHQSSSEAVNGNGNVIGVCRVDANAAAAAMAAMMQSYDLGNSGSNQEIASSTVINFKCGDVDEATVALRHLSQQFGTSSSTSSSQVQKQGAAGADSLNQQRNNDIDRFDDNNDDGEDYEGPYGGGGGDDNNAEAENEDDDGGLINNHDGVAQLASLRQIVAMRRNNQSNNNYVLQTPQPAHSIQNGTCYSSNMIDDGTNSKGNTISRPDVVIACISSQSDNSSTTAPATSVNTAPGNGTNNKCNCQLGACANCMGSDVLSQSLHPLMLMSSTKCAANGEATLQSEVLPSPLEQLLNHIEQKFSSSNLVVGGTMPTGTPSGLHRPILLTNSLLQQVHDSSNESPHHIHVPLSNSSSLVRHQHLHQLQQQSIFANQNQNSGSNNSDNLLFTVPATASTSLSSAFLGLSPSVESNTSVAASIVHTDC